MPYEHPTPLPPGVAVTPSAATGPQEPKQTKKAVATQEVNELLSALTTDTAMLVMLVRNGWREEAADVLPEIRAHLEKLEALIKHAH